MKAGLANSLKNVKAANDAKELNEASQALEAEINLEKSRNASFDSDSFLVNRAKNAGVAGGTAKTEVERSAAMHALGKYGRDGKLRMMQGNNDYSQVSLQSAIGSNVGSLKDRAPDLIKGNKAAFENVTGEDLQKFSAGTVETYMDYMNTATGAEKNNAIAAFGQAIEKIRTTESLRSSFKPDAAKAIINHTALISDPLLAAKATIVGSTFNSDGTIR
jgi:hypothetical protein